MRNAGATDINNPMGAKHTDRLIYHGKAWVSQTTYQKNIRFLQAVKFKHITDGECWLRGGGKITVQMHIRVDHFNYTGPPKEVAVNSNNNAFFDLEAISQRLADILAGHLRDNDNSAWYQFTGNILANIQSKWQKLAARWLIDDIRADPDVFEYLHYRDEDGKKLIIENEFIGKPFELDIEFIDGQCWFGVMASRLSEKAEKRYGEEIRFTAEQGTAAGKAMAPTLVHAVRHKRYSYPYSPETKKKLLDMAPYIVAAANYARISGVSKSALAGAVADALDDNEEQKVEQAYNLAERYWCEHVRREHEIYGLIVSLILTVVGAKVANEGASQAIDWAGFYWDNAPGQLQAEILAFLAKYNEKIKNLPEKIVTMIAARIRDRQNDYLVESELKKQIDIAKLSQLDAEALRKELRGLIIKTNDPLQLLCYSMFSDSQYRGKIIQHAKKIDRLLGDYEKTPQERDNVTKWERFYHYFR